ncbi:MAG: ATP-dependent sacrificial sulfur transferase LarE [Deltaproteobacteria bacterium]|nr:ATP-dependent sacrificial sulfur transferase LarE [Deltaproteobacteria bacterium]
MDIDAARAKREKLIDMLREMPSLLVGFSGGVDSSFLLAVARDVLKEHVTAATVDSIIFPSRERDEAAEFARKIGVEHIIFKSNESTMPEFTANGPDRCYFCKRALSAGLKRIAEEKGIAHIAFAANTDDLEDYRPGTRAAEEMGIISPLIEAGLNKEEIRFLSREMGLATWDKPSMACLATRIPYGARITAEMLKSIGDAEDFLSGMGFRQIRVRHHGAVARIEVSLTELPRFLEEELRRKVVKRFRELGFKHVSLDLEGFVSGSMNRVLTD